MNPTTLNQYNNVINNLLNNVKSDLKPVINYSFLKDCLQFAKNKAKLNNYLLKNNYNDPVYRVELYCEIEKGLKWYNIKPNKKNNTLFWVKFYTLEKSYVSYQTLKKELNNI